MDLAVQSFAILWKRGNTRDMVFFCLSYPIVPIPPFLKMVANYAREGEWGIYLFLSRMIKGVLCVYTTTAMIFGLAAPQIWVRDFGIPWAGQEKFGFVHLGAR